jgi:hypothetical protein
MTKKIRVKKGKILKEKKEKTLEEVLGLETIQKIIAKSFFESYKKNFNKLSLGEKKDSASSFYKENGLKIIEKKYNPILGISLKEAAETYCHFLTYISVVNYYECIVKNKNNKNKNDVKSKINLINKSLEKERKELIKTFKFEEKKFISLEEFSIVFTGENENATFDTTIISSIENNLQKVNDDFKAYVLKFQKIKDDINPILKLENKLPESTKKIVKSIRNILDNVKEKSKVVESFNKLNFNKK